VQPFLRRFVDRHDNFIGAVPGQNVQTVVSFHHG
jgi:hypothetical protein